MKQDWLTDDWILSFEWTFTLTFSYCYSSLTIFCSWTDVLADIHSIELSSDIISLISGGTVQSHHWLDLCRKLAYKWHNSWQLIGPLPLTLCPPPSLPSLPKCNVPIQGQLDYSYVHIFRLWHPFTQRHTTPSSLSHRCRSGSGLFSCHLLYLNHIQLTYSSRPNMAAVALCFSEWRVMLLPGWVMQAGATPEPSTLGSYLMPAYWVVPFPSRVSHGRSFQIHGFEH